MHDDEIRIEIDAAPSADDVAAVRDGLRAYNSTQVGVSDWGEFAVFLRDAAGSIVGGLLAETGKGWLHVSILWVSDQARGRGYGSELLTAAELEALRRGCHSVYLDTFSFQARPFYERHGYVVFGTLEAFPAGHERYFLRKTLVPV